MEDTGTYRSESIRPLAEPGENLLLLSNTRYRLYRVAMVEPLPLSGPLIVNLGAIVASAALPDQTVLVQNALTMGYGQLGQFRLRVLDDIWFNLKQPQDQTRLAVRSVAARISKMTNDADWLTEHFVFEDQTPTLGTPTNRRPWALVQSRVAWYGFKYVLIGKDGFARGGHLEEIKVFNAPEEAKAQGLKFRVLPQGGWAV